MKKDQTKLFAHFHSSEHVFVERCLDWIKQTVYNHQVVTTPFLDPREQQILTSLVHQQQDLIYITEGGMVSAERCRVMIGQPLWLDTTTQISLAFLRLSAASGNHLAHAQVLGSILGLGIQRDQVGDIYPHDQGCDLVVTEEMAAFIRLHLRKVGRETILIEEILLEQISEEKRVVRTKKVIVTSLRIDVVLSEGFCLSRGKMSKLIKSGKCKLDWKRVDKPGTLVTVGNLLSLRGYGRLSVGRIERKTKKGNYIICLSGFD